jgi:hypothetical protein
MTTALTTFAPSEASSYVGLALQDMFTLIHRASDSAVTSQASSSSTTTTKPNSAVGMRGDEHRLGLVASVCCVAFALGALLIV